MGHHGYGGDRSRDGYSAMRNLDQTNVHETNIYETNVNRTVGGTRSSGAHTAAAASPSLGTQKHLASRDRQRSPGKVQLKSDSKKGNSHGKKNEKDAEAKQ